MASGKGSVMVDLQRPCHLLTDSPFRVKGGKSTTSKLVENEVRETEPSFPSQAPVHAGLLGGL